MTNYNELYNNIERKKELIDKLDKLLEAQREAADALDSKAWNILSVTSATFGIIAALQITTSNAPSKETFWVALAAILGLYIWQIREISLVVTPMKWALVPGGIDEKNGYEELMKDYVACDDNEYLNKLITDYIGCYGPSDRKTFNLGAIQKSQKNNEEKAKHIRRAGWLLGGIVTGLIVMAVVAVM